MSERWRGALWAAAVAVALSVTVSAEVYLAEEFGSLEGWTSSTSKEDYGKVELSSGSFYGDKEINQGLKTTQDARFYATSRKLTRPFENKQKDMVVSISVKHEQGLDCGGGYVKLTPAMDATTFNGDSEYLLMFGPDKCGYNNRVHVIFNYKGENLLWKKEVKYPDDKLTHVYTLRVTPKNTYELFIDKELKESGSLEEDWAFLKAKMIDDPSDVKPANWVEEAQMDDPSDEKPADWDAEPATIVDPEAKKPEDWDDEEDGAWEAPQIANPKAKGPWKARQIPNPEYKGPWKARQIANPEYVADEELYLLRKPMEHVGIDVWQVKSGTIFDNIFIGDDLDEVNALVEKTWGATKEAEKTAEKAAEKAAAEAAKSEKSEESEPAGEEDL